MNKIIKLSLILFLLGWMSIPASSQDRTAVTGKVTDIKGEPMAGVTVIVKNRFGFGASTDEHGFYKISTEEHSVLVFSFIGYEPIEIPVEKRSVIDVQLKERDEAIEEVTVVAAGVQRKASVVGAISNVKMEELNIPSANLSNMLAGNVPGIIAIQRSGEPGQNRSEFWIRGISTFGANAGALVLVDGIEREFDEVNPEDIESFSVLKDASATAIYGQRGANGVVLITTKKGAAGKVKIDFKAEYGVKTPTRMPKYLNGKEYASLANEARQSRYMDPLYDESDIEIIDYNLDPDLFPNVDWHDTMLENTSSTVRSTLSLSGGGENARYFISGGYLNEGGLYKSNNLRKYDTNANYRRYNYRMNIDMNLSRTTVLEAGVSGWVVNQDKPGAETDHFFNSLAWMTPVTVPIKYSNGQWPAYGDKSDQASPYVLMNESGWKSLAENKTETNIGIKQDFGFLIKGLSLNARFSYDSWSRHDINRLRSPALYKAERVRDGLGQLITTRMVLQRDLEVSSYNLANRRYYGEAMLNYENVFGEKHRVGGLLFYYQQEFQVDDRETNAFKAVPKRNLALSGRVTYAYDDRYMLEFNFGYTGSENFERGKQYGFFPAIAGGWMISNEKFFKERTPWLNALKVRYSYGEVGNDKIGGDVNNEDKRFPYITTVGGNGWYNFGNMGSTHVGGIGIATMGAANLTWEVAKKHNIGVDLGLFNKFSLTVDFFKDNRDNIFMRRRHLPGTVGLEGDAQNPWGNVGRMQNKGIDGTFAFSQKIGEVALTLRGNFTYAKTKVLDYDEASNVLYYQMTKGYRLNQNRGLIALGLFKNEAEIASSPKQYGVDLLPGDIKYKDVNGDGVINDDDMVPLGYTKDPGLVYGLGMSLRWRSFDFNILFQGTENRDFFIGGIGVFPFANNEMGNVLKHAYNPNNRWIARDISGDPATEKQNVTFPRLAYGANNNNYKPSTHWLRDGSFLRLKNMEIGYTLPARITRKWKMERLRVYAIAYNLYCWSPFKWWDPELDTTDGTKYPIQLNVTFGLNISF